MKQPTEKYKMKTNDLKNRKDHFAFVITAVVCARLCLCVKMESFSHCVRRFCDLYVSNYLHINIVQTEYIVMLRKQK